MGSTSPTEAGALSVWDLPARGWSPVYLGVCKVRRCGVTESQAAFLAPPAEASA